MSKRLLFLGSDNISQICLKKLITSFPSFTIDLISTSLTSPPAKLASEHNLKKFCESKGSMADWKILDASSEIWASRYTYLISASFGYLIPASLICHADYSLNVHPSLLPKYRGSSPIQHAIYNRDKYTGTSIITIDPIKFDTGLILKQQQHPEPIEHETYMSLSEKLAVLGSELLVDVIKNYPEYLKTAVVQSKSESKLASRLDIEFSKLKLDNTEELYARFRAIYGTSMNPYLMFRKNRVNIMGMKLPDPKELEELNRRYPSAVPGSLWFIYPGIYVKNKGKSFAKQIDNVMYMRTKDGWIGLTNFIIASQPKVRNPISEFIANYVDTDLYTSNKSLAKISGHEIAFEEP